MSISKKVGLKPLSYREMQMVKGGDGSTVNVTETTDVAKGGAEAKTTTADADVVIIKKAEWEAVQKRLEKAEEVTKEVIETRQKAKAKADAEAEKAKAAEEKAKAEAEKAKPLEAKIADLESKIAASEKAQSEKEAKLNAELLWQKKLAVISGLQGLHESVTPETVLKLIDNAIKIDEGGNLDQNSIIEAINTMPFLKAAKVVEPKVNMANGRPNVKEPGEKDHPNMDIDSYIKEHKSDSNMLQIPK